MQASQAIINEKNISKLLKNQAVIKEKLELPDLEGSSEGSLEPFDAAINGEVAPDTARSNQGLVNG